MDDERNGLQTDPGAMLASVVASVRSDIDAAADAAESEPDEARARARFFDVLEARLRSRTVGLDRNPNRAPSDPLRFRLPARDAKAALRLARRIKFAALGLIGTRHGDK